MRDLDAMVAVNEHAQPAPLASPADPPGLFRQICEAAYGSPVRKGDRGDFASLLGQQMRKI
jgi:hypothetical protein